MFATFAGVLAVTVGIVPALYLAGRWRAGHRVGAAWWWLAAAFGVSFVADVASLFVGHALVSQTYPVSQAALFLAVMLPQRPVVERVIAGLLAVAATSILARQGLGLDVALHVLAWLAVSAGAWLFVRQRALRWTLGAGFAVLTVAWVLYAAWPGWATWGAYHVTRLAVAVGFCWAISFDRRTA